MMMVKQGNLKNEYISVANIKQEVLSGSIWNVWNFRDFTHKGTNFLPLEI